MALILELEASFAKDIDDFFYKMQVKQSFLDRSIRYLMDSFENKNAMIISHKIIKSNDKSS